MLFELTIFGSASLPSIFPYKEVLELSPRMDTWSLPFCSSIRTHKTDFWPQFHFHPKTWVTKLLRLLLIMDQECAKLDLPVMMLLELFFHPLLGVQDIRYIGPIKGVVVFFFFITIKPKILLYWLNHNWHKLCVTHSWLAHGLVNQVVSFDFIF